MTTSFSWLLAVTFFPPIWHKLHFLGYCTCSNKLPIKQYLWNCDQSFVPIDVPRDFGPVITLNLWIKLQIPFSRQRGRERSAPTPFVTDLFHPLRSVYNNYQILYICHSVLVISSTWYVQVWHSAVLIWQLRVRSCRSTHFKAVQVVLCSMPYVPVHTGTKYVAFMYMHLLNKISKLGNMANFDHFAKAIERQNGQKMAEFELFLVTSSLHFA